MAKDTIFQAKKTWNIKGKILSLENPFVMGILNVTPDSFFDGGNYVTESSILKKAEIILTEGASIIDIGGYSSRPGAVDITEKEEQERVIPAIRAILKEFPNAIISVDTFRSKIASIAIQEGASIINDISGGELDSEMIPTIANYQVPYVIMHMRGSPQTMQQNTIYENILLEIIDYFQKKIHQLIKQGIYDIAIDPGFGFSKTIDQNFLLLNQLEHFQILQQPILVGLSRKYMIYKSLEITSEEALNGTSILNTIGLLNGASILRVHDVKEAVQAIKLVERTTKSSKSM